MYSCSVSFNGWIMSLCMTYHFLFIHLLVDRHLGCFYHMAIMDIAARNICGQFFVCGNMLLSVLLNIPKSVNAHTTHCFVEKAIFQSRCKMLHPHQQGGQVPIFSTSSPIFVIVHLVTIMLVGMIDIPLVSTIDSCLVMVNVWLQ